MQNWSPKDPAETYAIAMDFTALVPSGQSISSSVWTCSVYSGNDPSPSSVLTGGPTTSGYTVSQGVTGGLNGTSYAIRVQITTSAGYVFVGTAVLPVITQTP